MRFEVPDGGDLTPVARALCDRLAPGDVVHLHGPIGAGKTTLVQACARAYGIAEPVTSPTFALAHRYGGPPPLAHLDLYRLEGAPRREPGDLLDAMGEEAISFVEWPDLGAPWLPPATTTVRITVLADGTRRFDLA